jgi:hypothetical protein
MERDDTMTCPFKSCLKQYRNSNSFATHLRRHHPDLQSAELSNVYKDVANEPEMLETPEETISNTTSHSFLQQSEH